MLQTTEDIKLVYGRGGLVFGKKSTRETMVCASILFVSFKAILKYIPCNRGQLHRSQMMVLTMSHVIADQKDKPLGRETVVMTDLDWC